MAILKTFDLKGNKLSFANWISNLSPSDTPFASMIKKEAVDQTMYSWQVDRLAVPANPTIAEGSEFTPAILAPTQVKSNFTQILRKVVRVTDTANKIGLYGRASETAYQMEKAGREIKRDLEKAMLTQKAGTAGTKDIARRFAGFQGLVAAEGLPCADTGAIVHKTFEPKLANDPAFGKEEIFDMTYNLYLAGSKANKIMVHPEHMHIFSGFIVSSNATRMFENMETKYNMYVGKVRDPLGQTFDVIPNRFMPKDKIYFFNENDWTQMILREPKSEQLARNGSSERHMIEMEVGLRHRNPFASGILALKAKTGADVHSMYATLTHPNVAIGTATKLEIHILKNGQPDTVATGITVASITPDPATGITVPTNMPAFANGKADCDINNSKAGTYNITVKLSNDLEDTVQLIVHSKDVKSVATLDEEQAEKPVVAKATKAKTK